MFGLEKRVFTISRAILKGKVEVMTIVSRLLGFEAKKNHVSLLVFFKLGLIDTLFFFFYFHLREQLTCNWF